MIDRGGKFNTDSKALVNRIDAHSAFGTNDLNSWILGNLNLSTGCRVLDLGCGTGKQSIAIAEKIGESGAVTSIDLSDESLKTLRTEAEKLGLTDRISATKSDLDNIDGVIEENHYDNIVSSYALYYCSDPEKTFSTLYDALKPGGVIFFCGPSRENNSEIKSFHYSLAGVSPQMETFASRFMEDDGPEQVKSVFQNIEIREFRNPLKFDSSDALYKYWSSYNLYDEELDSIFKERAALHFQSHDHFETVKRVIGIRAIKPSQ
ncbi:MAG: methyltransferase domain-containing protein [Pyrinomonadaceae bacterium]|nr:methyltransferase domain-containing protein [Pyrinomonadaceae bacterium]